jgi:hypothetical protein
MFSDGHLAQHFWMSVMASGPHRVASEPKKRWDYPPVLLVLAGFAAC